MTARSYNIDSRLRVSGTPSQFRAQFSLPVEQGRYTIDFVRMSNTFYNITPSNNRIYFNDSTTTAFIGTITPGYYNATTIVTGINSAFVTAVRVSDGLGAPATAIVCSYDFTSNRITFASVANFSFLFGTYQVNVAAQTLGFDAVNTTASLDFVTPNGMDLVYVYSALIDIKQSRNDMVLTNRNSGFGTFIENMFSPLGSEQITTFRDFNRYLIIDQRSRYLDISVRNSRFQEVALLENDWSFQITQIST